MNLHFGLRITKQRLMKFIRTNHALQNDRITLITRLPKQIC